MKTLVLVSHPDLGKSMTNKRWVDELRRYPDRYTVHEINLLYPDGVIDVEAEQKLVEAHGALVLQFPIFWFGCPPLMKKWLDDVFTYGWAYGSKSEGLRDRPVALAVTTGIRESDYGPDGVYRYTLEEFLSPFEATFRYARADYRPCFASYGTGGAPTDEDLDAGVLAYRTFLDGLEVSGADSSQG